MKEQNPKSEGLVIWTMGHKSRVLIGDDTFIVPTPGKWRLGRQGNRPLAPGDKLNLVFETDHWRMTDRIPRVNEFTRRFPSTYRPVPQIIAANLDLAVIVAAADEPMTPLGLIDRLLVTAELGGVKPILVINKSDLIEEEDREEYRAIYVNAVETILFTSAETREGVDSLREIISGKTVLFAGASGVGKSSLANCIDPDLDLNTGEISEATGKGRHTTTTAELHPLAGGGWVTDTPGLRECGPWGKTPQNLGSAFPEMRRVMSGCKFRDCLHKTDKGCAVMPIVDTEKFAISRYENYLKLLDEALEETKPDYRK